jgi:folate-binding protein YgfZ
VTSYLARLDHLGTLEFSGPDSRQFLQGQTTCDIESLDEGHSLAGAYCNPQGRMVCDFRLRQVSPERILAVLEADVAAAALQTFDKYILFSRAQARDVSKEWVHYGLWGSLAEELAGTATANASWTDDAVMWTLLDIPQTLHASVPAAAADAFQARFAAAETTSAERFREREILAGIGHVSARTSGEFLPQALNYQFTGRVSFTKGCYTGQEVVARLHYRGKVKRPALLAEVIADGVARAGDKLFAAGSDRSVGDVINAVASPAGGQLLLASVATNALDDGVTLGPNGPQLAFRELPYSIDDD